MLTAVSLNAEYTADFIFHLLAINSCLYLAKKWIVSSTEIPKAILKTKMVEGLRGIPENPITPAVIISGNKLGINEMTIILNDRNKYAINIAISKMASDREKIKFRMRKWVPLRYNKVFPVNLT